MESQTSTPRKVRPMKLKLKAFTKTSAFQTADELIGVIRGILKKSSQGPARLSSSAVRGYKVCSDPGYQLEIRKELDDVLISFHYVRAHEKEAYQAEIVAALTAAGISFEAPHEIVIPLSANLTLDLPISEADKAEVMQRREELFTYKRFTSPMALDSFYSEAFGDLYRNLVRNRLVEPTKFPVSPRDKKLNPGVRAWFILKPSLELENYLRKNR